MAEPWKDSPFLWGSGGAVSEQATSSGQKSQGPRVAVCGKDEDKAPEAGQLPDPIQASAMISLQVFPILWLSGQGADFPTLRPGATDPRIGTPATLPEDALCSSVLITLPWS